VKFLCDELTYRAQLKKPVQTPNDETGGYDISYTTIKTFWLGLQEESPHLNAVRGVNIGEGVTQIGKARYQALQSLGAAFNNAFSYAFDSIPDINTVKSNYFIFVQEDSATRGRLFRIMGMARDEKNRQLIKIQMHYVEEQGTGFQI